MSLKTASIVVNVFLVVVKAQKLSEKADVTLAELDEMCGLTAGSIKKYAWSYPNHKCNYIQAGDDLQKKFKVVGGFVYFDEKDTLICKTTLGGNQTGGFELRFGEPQTVESSCSVWAPITFKTLVHAGARNYCWEPNTANGLKGFHYKTADGATFEFPMVKPPETNAVGGFPKSIGPFYLHKIDVNTDAECEDYWMSGVAPRSLALPLLSLTFVARLLV
jgi:hypothetical protein